MRSLRQHRLEMAFEFAEVDQAAIQHEHHVVQIRLETTGNLAQREGVEIINEDFERAELSQGAPSL